MLKSIIPESLFRLAEIFKPFAPLYIVGGAVRNSLLGYPVSDYDITSKLLPQKVEELLLDTNYNIVASYKRTGTLVIKVDNIKFEYTTFRQDSYPLKKGDHKPTKCIFTDNIKEDALRRDFTCNALYYDIIENKIIDLVGGVQDINNKVLRAVRDVTLSEDALRIMRLVRFYVQLGFGIETETLKDAKKYSFMLKDISKERIKDELIAIFEGVFKYNSKNNGVNPSDGIRMLVDIGAMEHIIPEINLMIGMPQNTKYHLYDVYNHTLKIIDYLPPRLMMAGLLHDIAKAELYNKYGNMYTHEIVGSDMAKDILTRLKFSQNDTQIISRLVKIHMFNVDGKTRMSKCRVFIADNIDYFDDFIMLRRADGMATNPNNYDDSATQKLIDLKDKMINDNMPFTIKDLPINGNDLLSLGYCGKEVGELLGKIRLWILQNGRVPTKEEIINRLTKN